MSVEIPYQAAEFKTLELVASTSGYQIPTATKKTSALVLKNPDTNTTSIFVANTEAKAKAKQSDPTEDGITLSVGEVYPHAVDYKVATELWFNSATNNDVLEYVNYTQ